MHHTTPTLILAASLALAPWAIAQSNPPVTFQSLSTTGTPSAIRQHAMCPIPGGGFLLFGGASSAGPNQTTYTLTGSTWTAQFPPFSPVTRTGHALTLDQARQNVVLFGGKNPNGTLLPETWTWANGAWSLASTPNAPSPRSGHRMCFDTQSQTCLLFGGESATGAALGDFWSWNGTTWSQLSPNNLPPARSRHGMVLDALRSRVVLFGGLSGTTRLQDTWDWDGTNWTNVTPQTPTQSPSARDGHSMTYDPRSERIVLHGGATTAGCQSDVWSWNGTAWILHTPGAGTIASARTDAQLVHDQASNTLRLFGGGCGSSSTSDFWSLTMPTFASAVAYGQPCVGSAGPLGLRVLPGSLPVIGQTFRMELTNVPGFAPCFGLLGFSNTTIAGAPLPLALEFLNMPGCLAYMSKDMNFPLSLQTNVSLPTPWDLALPLDPVFLSLHIYLQGLTLEFGSARFATATNGIDARIGDR